MLTPLLLVVALVAFVAGVVFALGMLVLSASWDARERRARERVRLSATRW